VAKDAEKSFIFFEKPKEYYMKKILRVSILFFAYAQIVFAESVPIEKAADVAKNWYLSYCPKKTKISRTRISRESGIKNVQTEKYNDQDTFYIINMSSGGFVLVAADDNIYPVLGYSFESEMDQNSMNPAARAWLNNYSVQIESAISSGITNIQAAQEWEKQDNSDQSMDSAPLNIPSVPPLISTKWGQGTFYNTFTPLNTPVGCVAVAMAQIMKYHNFPETGTGQNAYTHDTYGVLSADFNTQYKWSKMPDQLTSQSLPEDISAVAELIYHCGISVDMDYAVSTSIASTGDVATSRSNYCRGRCFH
jgi:hypothetical protein